MSWRRVPAAPCFVAAHIPALFGPVAHEDNRTPDYRDANIKRLVGAAASLGTMTASRPFGNARAACGKGTGGKRTRGGNQ